MILINADRFNMKLKNIFYLSLIAFNLVSLYFIIELLSYDEIVGSVVSGVRTTSVPRKLAYLLFITCLLNLYFLSLVLMETFFNDKL